MEKIAIVGMGKIGTAIESRLVGNYEVTTIGRQDDLSQVEAVDTVILAVKPQAFNENGGVADDLWMHVHDQLFLSVMAGVNTTRLRRRLGTDRVLRTMPNLAISTGESLTAWYAEKDIVEVEAVQALLNTWGESVRLNDEALFDPFTAIFGSGPGFVYKFMSHLERQAVAYGFDARQAGQMINQMFRGAASLVGPDSSFDVLADGVASKRGTTLAGFGAFEKHDLEGTVREAVGAACMRSQELGQN
jgi:pyrroline-5-carboxylate reductase